MQPQKTNNKFLLSPSSCIADLPSLWWWWISLAIVAGAPAREYEDGHHTMIMFFITMEALPDEPVTTEAAVSCNGSWICMSIHTLWYGSWYICLCTYHIHNLLISLSKGLSYWRVSIDSRHVRRYERHLKNSRTESFIKPWNGPSALQSTGHSHESHIYVLIRLNHESSTVDTRIFVGSNIKIVALV